LLLPFPAAAPQTVIQLQAFLKTQEGQGLAFLVPDLAGLAQADPNALMTRQLVGALSQTQAWRPGFIRPLFTVQLSQAMAKRDRRLREAAARNLERACRQAKPSVTAALEALRRRVKDEAKSDGSLTPEQAREIADQLEQAGLFGQLTGNLARDIRVMAMVQPALQTLTGGCAESEAAAPSEPVPAPAGKTETTRSRLSVVDGLRADLDNAPPREVAPLARALSTLMEVRGKVGEDAVKALFYRVSLAAKAGDQVRAVTLLEAAVPEAPKLAEMARKNPALPGLLRHRLAERRHNLRGEQTDYAAALEAARQRLQAAQEQLDNDKASAAVLDWIKQEDGSRTETTPPPSEKAPAWQSILIMLSISALLWWGAAELLSLLERLFHHL
ncbi:MAG: hypothetical protein KGK30_09435, partial [Elusimicrobia bacterium]|nr:hypothetical protein [Elusimicrobiota bacterium]